MIRVVTAGLVLSVFLACGGDGPKRSNQPSESYVIKSVIADPSRRSIIIDISIDPQSSESDVKAAAEALIAQHKAEYSSILVRSHLTADTSGLPYGTSSFESGVTTHSFSPKAAREKIGTH